MSATMDSSREKNSLWLFGALAAMLASACCVLFWMNVVGMISGWIGLPEYEPRIPALRWYAWLWSSLAVIFPFLAGLLLSRGERREQGLDGIGVYLLRVGISVLGGAGFLIVIILLGFLLKNLGFWPH